jgi:hypothetical protein
MRNATGACTLRCMSTVISSHPDHVLFCSSTFVRSGDRGGHSKGPRRSIHPFWIVVTRNVREMGRCTVWTEVLLTPISRDSFLVDFEELFVSCCRYDIVSCSSRSAREWAVEDDPPLLGRLNNTPRSIVIDRLLNEVISCRSTRSTFLTVHDNQAHSFVPTGCEFGPVANKMLY